MFCPTKKISKVLTEIQELDGVSYCVVHYYNGFLIFTKKLKYKQEGNIYRYQYIERNKEEDRILIGETTEKRVIHDFDGSEYNEMVDLCSIKYSNNQPFKTGDMNEAIFMNPLFSRAKYGFILMNGWDNLDRITIIQKGDFMFKLKGWFQKTSKEPIKRMITELRIVDMTDDVILDWDDITEGLCAKGITEFLEMNPDYKQLASISALELIQAYNGPEIVEIIKEKKRKLYNL